MKWIKKINTLWIIDNQVPVNRINSEWQIINPILYDILKNIGLGVKTISNLNNVASSDYANRICFSAELNRKLFDNITFIKDRDIILFTDARSSLLHDIYEYFILKGIRPYMIGVWIDGYWNDTSIYKKMYQKRKFAYEPLEYERTLAKMFDLNIVPNEMQYTYFKSRVSRKSKFINLPFKFLSDAYEATSMENLFDTKLDIILFNSDDGSGKSEVLKNKYDLLVKQLFEFELFDISSIKTHNIIHNLPILGKSKIMINLNYSTSAPIEIYHALQMGILTLTVENAYLQSIGYPEELMLNKTEINHDKLYRYIRYIDTIRIKIESIKLNYNSLIEENKKILNPVFLPDTFLKLIKDVKNRK